MHKIVSAGRYIDVNHTEHSINLQKKTTRYMLEVSIKIAKCSRKFAFWPFSHQKQCVNTMVPFKSKIMNFDVIIHILLTSNILKS